MKKALVFLAADTYVSRLRGALLSLESTAILLLTLASMIGRPAIADPAVTSPTDEAKGTTVTHIAAGIYGNSRRQYEADLIELALEKTRAAYGAYRIEAAPMIHSSSRDARIIKNKSLENFVRAFSVHKDLIDDPELIYIEFPVMRGSLGYRICLTSKANKKRLEKVKTFDDLLKFNHVQGIGWRDTLILRHAGFEVVEAGQYSSIFEMAARSRADLFCRGISEYLNEWEFFKSKLPQLAIEDSFIIFYPFPRYFFTHSDNQAVLDRIEAGIKAANKDGSFVALWNRYHLAGIEHAKIAQRKIYTLENPFLEDIEVDYAEFLYPIPIEAASAAVK